MSRLSELLTEALEIAVDQDHEKESKDFAVERNFKMSIELGLERGKLMKLEEILRPANEAARSFDDNPFDCEPEDTEAMAKTLLEAGRILGVE